MAMYRIIALLILSIPIAVNIYNKGDIVSSIIYVPLITLGLSCITIFIDSKLESLLKKAPVLPILKVSKVDIQQKTLNDGDNNNNNNNNTNNSITLTTNVNC
jgi:hypothetical protein